MSKNFFSAPILQYTQKKAYSIVKQSEAVFLVVCDPSMNELWAT